MFLGTSTLTQPEQTMAQKPEEEKTANDTAEQAKGPPQLHADLQALLDGFRKQRDFKAEEWIDKKCQLFNEYMTNNKLKGCVINLSGGVDSAVTLGLMCRAKAQKGSSLEKVLAISQPIHSSDWAFNRAAECAKAFGVEMVTIDQTPIYDSLKELIDGKTGVEGNSFASGQLRCVHGICSCKVTSNTQTNYILHFHKFRDWITCCAFLSKMFL